MPEGADPMQEMLPREAYRFLAENPEALFIDCRSDAEFYFVGHPVGANHVAWQDGAIAVEGFGDRVHHPSEDERAIARQGAVTDEQYGG